VQRLVKLADAIGDWMGVVAGLLLVSLMLLVVTNVVARQVASAYGSTAELVGYLSALIAAFALPYSQKKKAHIAIDLLTQRFPARLTAGIVGVLGLVAVAVFGMAAWQIIVRAGHMRQTGTLSDTLQIAYYPLLWIVAACVFLFAVRLLIYSMAKVSEAVKP